MAALAGALRADVEANVASFKKNMNDAADSVDRFGNRASKSAKKVGDASAFSLQNMRSLAQVAGVAAFGAFTKSAIEGAAAAERFDAQIENVFGDNAGQVKDWAKSASDSLGEVDDNLQSAVVNFGLVFQAAVPLKAQAAGLSETFAGLAVDLARFKGVDTAAAAEALQKGLQGSTRGLHEFGIELTEAQVNNRAVQMGLAQTADRVSEGAKVQARANLIWAQTTKVQGYAAKQAGTTAGEYARLQKEVDDLSDAFGATLIPIILHLTEDISDLWNAWLGGFAEVGKAVGDLELRMKFGFNNPELEKQIKLFHDNKGAIDETAAAAKAAAPTLKDMGKASDFTASKKRGEEFILESAQMEQAAASFAKNLDPLAEKIVDTELRADALVVSIHKQIQAVKEAGLSSKDEEQSLTNLNAALARVVDWRDAVTQSVIAQDRAEQNLLDAQATSARQEMQDRISQFHEAAGASGNLSGRQQDAVDTERNLAKVRVDSATQLAGLESERAKATADNDANEVERLDGLIAQQKEYDDLVNTTSAAQLSAQKELSDLVNAGRSAFAGSLADLGKGVVAAGAQFDFKGWAGSFVQNLAGAMIDKESDVLTDNLFDFLGLGKKKQEVDTINAKTLNVSGSGGAGGGGTGNGLIDGITTGFKAAGGDKAAGSGGGLWGMVGSWVGGLFSGAHAEGGFVPPGHWGTKQEDEPVWGGRHGVTVQPTAQSASGGGNVYMTVVADDPNSFRHSSRQISRGLRRGVLASG